MLIFLSLKYKARIAQGLPGTSEQLRDKSCKEGVDQVEVDLKCHA